MKKIMGMFGNNGLYVISFDPVIVICYEKELLSNFQKFRGHLPKDKSIYFLVLLGWHRETPERALELKNDFGKTITEDRFKVIFLTNSVREESLLRETGLTAYFCHKSSFLDESRYKVLDTAGKKYDAIYVARITPFKRHLLAKKINSLFLIADHSKNEEQYFRSVMAELSHAAWKRKVSSWNLYKYLNQARVGLCLSKEEGAMWVSAEYLLSGIPVVNTPNLGGRDHFLLADNSITCADNADAVKDAVDALIKKDLDPHSIREKTIQRFQVHRDKFKSIIQEIYDRESVKRVFRDEWDKVFVHKFGLRRSWLALLFSKRGLRI